MSHGLFNRCLCYVSGPENIAVALLFPEGQRALGFNQKYLNLCSEDEQRSYGFGTNWGRVLNDRIFIFGWTNPLITVVYLPFPVPRIAQTWNLTEHHRDELKSEPDPTAWSHRWCIVKHFIFKSMAKGRTPSFCCVTASTLLGRPVMLEHGSRDLFLFRQKSISEVRQWRWVTRPFHPKYSSQ